MIGELPSTVPRSTAKNLDVIAKTAPMRQRRHAATELDARRRHQEATARHTTAIFHAHRFYFISFRPPGCIGTAVAVLCFTADVSFFSSFQREISELPRPIALKLCDMIGSGLDVVI